MREFVIKAPIWVELGKKKKKRYYLNLNIMRNQVGHLINNVKVEYKRIVEPLLPHNVCFEHYELDYELFLPDKRKRDISNVLSIVDKNFCDTLVTTGHVLEDNYENLKKVTYRYGRFDEEGKGYVLITVKEVKG